MRHLPAPEGSQYPPHTYVISLRNLRDIDTIGVAVGSGNVNDAIGNNTDIDGGNGDIVCAIGNGNYAVDDNAVIYYGNGDIVCAIGNVTK